MSESTAKSPSKPAKPRPDFPLFPHQTGRWAKKVRGKLRYFGPWDDPQGALEKWLDQKDDLLAGRTPRGRQQGLVLKDLANAFLTFKGRQVASGELRGTTFHDYKRVTDRLIAHFGGGRLVLDISPQEFGHFRAKLAEGVGLLSLTTRIIFTRSVFRYAYDNKLIDRPVRFGSEFRKPSPKSLRIAKSASGKKRFFDQSEIKTLLAAVEDEPQMKAMILLGLNAGFNGQDCGDVGISALDLDAGFVELPRSKTGIPRRCPLWPETIQAIREVLRLRREPKSAADKEALFVTATGKRWVRFKKHARKDHVVRVNNVGMRFGRVMEKAKLERRGGAFGALRHVFRTIADEVPDRPAIDLIMGHQNPNDMSTHYRERLADDRLRRVTDHVHAWVFPSEQAQKAG